MTTRRRRAKNRALKTLFITLIALVLVVASFVVADVVRKRGEATKEAELLAAASEAQAQAAAQTPAPTPATQRSTPTPGITPEPAPVQMPLPWPSYAPAAINAPEPSTSTEADYAFYWFTDTQHYSDKYPETFHAMTTWMRDNAQRYNVQYAFMTGDLVHRNASDNWEVADPAMARLEEVIPVFTVAGNHDVGTSNPNYTNYKKYFGPERYKNNTHIVEWFDGGRGRCDVIEIQGTKFIFAGLGWKAHANGGISWLNGMLQKYPEHHAILLFHDYIDSEGLLSSAGQTLYEKVVKANPNVFMVLCGHRYNCILLTTDINDTGDRENYRTVYNLMMNYQAFENGGDGFLCLIRVYKQDRVMTFDTYSPVLNKWYHFDPVRRVNKERLTLPVTIFD